MTPNRLGVLRRKLRRLARRGVGAAVDPLARLAGTITGVDVDRPVAALTFDDGPDPDATPKLLDLLAIHGIRATFFCVGRFAEEHPEIVRRAHDEGHVVGNHTWDHPSMPHVSSRERRRQLERCSGALAPYESPFFRPPYGNQSPASHLDALRSGYQVVGWEADGQDWLDHDGRRIADRIESRIRPGSIVLLHDRIFSAPDLSYLDREPLLEGVRILVERFGSDFEFVTVPELMKQGTVRRTHWYRSEDVDWLNSMKAPDGHVWQYAD